MSALGGLVLLAVGFAGGWLVCWHGCREARLRVRDNIRRIRRQEEQLVAELAECERENAELRDFLQWERQESA